MNVEHPLADLPRLDAKTAQWLAAVDIRSRADLEATGPVEAYKLVRDHGFHPTLHLLWALAGALRDEPWEHLPQTVKQELIDALAERPR